MNPPNSQKTNRPPPRFISALGGACAILATFVIWFLLKNAPTHPTKQLPSANPNSALENRSGGNRPAPSITRHHLRSSPSKSETAIPSGPDAANLYKDAFVLYDRLSDEEKKILNQPKDKVDDDTARALFAKIQPIIDLLKQAAQINQCDWGFGDYSFETPMPQLVKSVNLAKLALWDATYEFPQDPAAALDVLHARAQLGHNLADTLVGSMVEFSFNAGANDLIQQNAASLDPAGLQAATAFLSNGNSMDADLARAMQGETELLQNAFETLLNLPSTEQQQAITMLSGVNANSPNAADTENEIKRALSDPVLLQVQLDHIIAIENQFAQALNWPNAQFQSWWEGVQSAAGNYPLETMLLLPALDDVRQKLQRSEVQNALVSAGLQVLQNGPGQLTSLTDPQTGLPFTYTPTVTGFDLTSSFLYKGKPVTASFPTQPAR